MNLYVATDQANALFFISTSKDHQKVCFYPVVVTV